MRFKGTVLVRMVLVVWKDSEATRGRSHVDMSLGVAAYYGNTLSACPATCLIPLGQEDRLILHASIPTQSLSNSPLLFQGLQVSHNIERVTQGGTLEGPGPQSASCGSLFPSDGVFPTPLSRGALFISTSPQLQSRGPSQPQNGRTGDGQRWPSSAASPQTLEFAQCPP